VIAIVVRGKVRSPSAHGFERLGAVEVVVSLDDQAISQSLHDGEGLGVRRVALSCRV